MFTISLGMEFGQAKAFQGEFYPPSISSSNSKLHVNMIKIKTKHKKKWRIHKKTQNEQNYANQKLR